MTVPTKIKSGAKITVAGEYEADIRKVDTVTIANKAQLTGDNVTIGLSYVDKVTGSKFNDTVQLHNAPIGTGTMDLGAGNDTLKLDAGNFKLTLKNTETVIGTEGEQTLQLSSVAAFSTDGSIDTILGDKSGQTVTYTHINANSTVDLGAGSDKIVLDDSIGAYSLALVHGEIVVTENNTDNHFTLTLQNPGASKTLKIVIGGQTYTWAQAVAYASDVSADADHNFDVNVGAAFSVVNAAERSAVTTTLTGVDSDARSVIVSFTDGSHPAVTVNAVKQLNGSWTVPAANLSGLNDGNITVSAVVTDLKGNHSQSVNPHIIQLDTHADTGDELVVSLAGDLANISQTAKDHSNVTPVAFVVDGVDDDVNSVVVRISDGTHTVTATFDADSGHYLANLTSLNNAPLIVTATVGDAAGNFASGSHAYNVANDSFNGTVTEFQAVESFDGYVSVIVTDTANAFNGSDLSGGQWGAVNSVNVTDNATVTFSAAELAGLNHLVLGNGNFLITGTGAQVAALPASILNSLGHGDTLAVTDALTVAQAGDLINLESAAALNYAITDSAAALVGADVGVLATATAITVNTAATVTQLDTIIDHAGDVSVNYTTVADQIGDLVPDGAASVIHSGTNVIVLTGEGDAGGYANLAQYNAINAANGSGTIEYRLRDSAANLFGNDNTLETGAADALGHASTVNISNEEGLNLAQANAVKGAFGGSVSDIYYNLTDSVANLFSGPVGFASGAAEAIGSADWVTISGGLTFNRALLVNGANGNSYNRLNYSVDDTELNLFNGDGVATLRSDASDMLDNAQAINVSGNGLTVAQAAELFMARGNLDGVTLTIVDTAAHIVASEFTALFDKNDGGAVTVNVSPAAVEGLSVTDLGILADRADNAVTYSLSLSELQIFTGNDQTTFNPGYAVAIHGATAVTVTNDLTPAQATAIAGQTSHAVYNVSSNAADALNVSNAAGVNGANNLTITGLVSADDSSLLAAITNIGTKTYHVSDIASEVVANAVGANAAASIVVTDLVDVATAATIHGFAAPVKTYSVSDTAAHIAGAAAADMNGAADISVTDLATLSQAATIYNFTNSGATSYSISDSAAGVFTGSAFNGVNGEAAFKAATAATVTGSVTVAQATALKAAIDGNNAIAAVSYSVLDTKAALLAADVALFTTDNTVGAVRTVIDADIDDTNIGSVTTAQLNALYDRIGHDQSLTYTLSYTVADLFTTPTGTTYQTGIAAAIQAASSVVIGEALTAAQAQAVYTTNQDGSPASLVMDVSDSSANILNGANANGVNAAHNISVTGATPATDVANIEALTNTGSQHYAQVTGAAAAVETALGASGALQLSVTDVVVTGTTATADVTIIEGYANTGATSYDTVGGSAAQIKGLLNGHRALQEAITDLTVTGTTSTADFVTIENYYVIGTPTFAVVSGNATDVADVLANFDYDDISQLAVTGTSSAQEIAGIETYGITSTYAALQDTTAHVGTLLAGHGALQSSVGTVTVTDTSTIAEASTIHAFTNTGATSFAGVSGIAGDVRTALDAQAGFQGEIAAITVTGNATTADVTAIENYVNTGNQTYDTVTGSSANVLTVVGGGGQGLQQDITTLHVTGTTTFADATTIEGYDTYVGTVTMDLVTASLGEFLDSDNAGVFADATEVHLTSYNLGAVTVAQVEALLASVKLKDGGSGALTISDLTYTLSDTIGHLASGSGNTAAIVTGATSATASDDATVAQAKVLYDRNAASTFDITDTAAWLATSSGVGSGATYDTVIKAAVDITSSNDASAAQAAAILARDGAGGDVFYNVSGSFSSLTSYGTATSYAGEIRASMPGTLSGGADNATTLVALAEAVDANGTAKLFMGDLSYDSVSDWSTFVGAHAYAAGTLEYTYKVYDSASNITTAALGADLPILTGSAFVSVSDTMLVSQAETLWNAVVAPFGGTSAAAGKTTYSITDTVAHLTNAKVNVVGNADAGDGAGVANADSIYVNDTAANIHAAQSSDGTINGSDADVFQRMNELDNGGITASGSAGYQIIAGTKHGDYIDGGTEGDVLYGNDGNDTLFGGAGADALYGGEGRDTIYAGSAAGVGTGSNYYLNIQDVVVGGNGGDNMFGSGTSGNSDRDQFQYVGTTRAELIAESGTYTTTRDYISNMGLGDSIEFTQVSDGNVQFFGSGSANAQAVTAGTLAISIRYEKNQQVMDWADNTLVTATKVLVDIANASGAFDDVADMTIIVVGSNIDLNWNGSALAFGG